MERFREMIRRLSPGMEFLIVIFWAFGQFIFATILSIGTPRAAAYTNQALASVLIAELLQFAFIAWFLHVRGWTLEKVGLRITWKSTGIGWLLVVGTYIVAMGALYVAGLVAPSQHRAGQALYPVPDPHVSMQLVFLTSTVNGIFEELFVAGYVVTALREARGVWTAINVSTVLRLLYHLYQGPLGIVIIVPMGVLYGYTYARTRQLWPLMFAHVLIDIIGLSAIGGWLGAG